MKQESTRLTIASQTVNRAVIRRIRDGKYQSRYLGACWTDLDKAYVFRNYHHAKPHRTKGTEILPVKLTISINHE